LIDKGANVNAKSRDGFTPLHVAAMRGNLPVVELLLESGADPNAIVQYGKTPAELARALNCGVQVEPGAKYCDMCGTKLK
jgi:ankyrin repeat protein